MDFFKNKLWAAFTLLCFSATQFANLTPAVAAPSAPEISVPVLFQPHLPAQLGNLESIHSGNNSVLFHIQEAHGNVEGQKNIQKILHYLKNQYGVDLVLLEGDIAPLKPELLQFFPKDHAKTKKALNVLLEKGVITGPELFLTQEKNARALGIEDLNAYVQNGQAFVDVLNAKKTSEKFLADLDLQIERLVSAYLNLPLRNFLKSQEKYEAHVLQLEAWLTLLKKTALETLKIDLNNPAQQIEWPMLVRIAKLKAIEKRLNSSALEQERKKFLITIKPYMQPAFLKELDAFLSQSLSAQPLSGKASELLIEEMARRLPENFNYQIYPNLNLFIGHVLLQRELNGDQLIREMETLTDRISSQLASESQEKEIVSLLKSYRLLKKLFSLEVTPREFEQLTQINQIPSTLVSRFSHLNQSNQVKSLTFSGLSEMDALYAKGMKFYRGAKERDSLMISNIEKKMKETGKKKAVVITGGFHSKPFENYFKDRGYNYALVTPKISGNIEKRDAYIETMLRGFIPAATYRLADLSQGRQALQASHRNVTSESSVVRQTLVGMGWSPAAYSEMRKIKLAKSGVAPSKTKRTWSFGKSSAPKKFRAGLGRDDYFGLEDEESDARSELRNPPETFSVEYQGNPTQVTVQEMDLTELELAQVSNPGGHPIQEVLQVSWKYGNHGRERRQQAYVNRSGEVFIESGNGDIRPLSGVAGLDTGGERFSDAVLNREAIILLTNLREPPKAEEPAPRVHERRRAPYGTREKLRAPAVTQPVQPPAPKQPRVVVLEWRDKSGQYRRAVLIRDQFIRQFVFGLSSSKPWQNSEYIFDQDAINQPADLEMLRALDPQTPLIKKYIPAKVFAVTTTPAASPKPAADSPVKKRPERLAGAYATQAEMESELEEFGSFSGRYKKNGLWNSVFSHSDFQRGITVTVPGKEGRSASQETAGFHAAFYKEGDFLVGVEKQIGPDLKAEKIYVVIQKKDGGFIRHAIPLQLHLETSNFNFFKWAEFIAKHVSERVRLQPTQQAAYFQAELESMFPAPMMLEVPSEMLSRSQDFPEKTVRGQTFVEIAPGLWVRIHEEPKGAKPRRYSWEEPTPPTHYEYSVEVTANPQRQAEARYLIRERVQSILGYQLQIKPGDNNSSAKVSAAKVAQASTVSLLVNSPTFPSSVMPLTNITNLRVNDVAANNIGITLVWSANRYTRDIQLGETRQIDGFDVFFQGYAGSTVPNIQTGVTLVLLARSEERQLPHVWAGDFLRDLSLELPDTLNQGQWERIRNINRLAPKDRKGLSQRDFEDNNFVLYRSKLRQRGEVSVYLKFRRSESSVIITQDALSEHTEVPRYQIELSQNQIKISGPSNAAEKVSRDFTYKTKTPAKLYQSLHLLKSGWLSLVVEPGFFTAYGKAGKGESILPEINLLPIYITAKEKKAAVEKSIWMIPARSEVRKVPSGELRLRKLQGINGRHNRKGRLQQPTRAIATGVNHFSSRARSEAREINVFRSIDKGEVTLTVNGQEWKQTVGSPVKGPDLVGPLQNLLGSEAVTWDEATKAIIFHPKDAAAISISLDLLFTAGNTRVYPSFVEAIGVLNRSELRNSTLGILRQRVIHLFLAGLMGLAHFLAPLSAWAQQRTTTQNRQGSPFGGPSLLQQQQLQRDADALRRFQPGFQQRQDAQQLERDTRFGGSIFKNRQPSTTAGTVYQGFNQGIQDPNTRIENLRDGAKAVITPQGTYTVATDSFGRTLVRDPQGNVLSVDKTWQPELFKNIDGALNPATEQKPVTTPTVNSVAPNLPNPSLWLQTAPNRTGGSPLVDAIQRQLQSSQPGSLGGVLTAADIVVQPPATIIEEQANPTVAETPLTSEKKLEQLLAEREAVLARRVGSNLAERIMQGEDLRKLDEQIAALRAQVEPKASGQSEDEKSAALQKKLSEIVDASEVSKRRIYYQVASHYPKFQVFNSDKAQEVMPLIRALQEFANLSNKLAENSEKESLKKSDIVGAMQQYIAAINKIAGFLRTKGALSENTRVFNGNFESQEFRDYVNWLIERDVNYYLANFGIFTLFKNSNLQGFWIPNQDPVTQKETVTYPVFPLMEGLDLMVVKAVNPEWLYKDAPGLKETGVDTVIADRVDENLKVFPRPETANQESVNHGITFPFVPFGILLSEPTEALADQSAKDYQKHLDQDVADKTNPFLRKIPEIFRTTDYLTIMRGVRYAEKSQLPDPKMTGISSVTVFNEAEAASYAVQKLMFSFAGKDVFDIDTYRANVRAAIFRNAAWHEGDHVRQGQQPGYRALNILMSRAKTPRETVDKFGTLTELTPRILSVRRTPAIYLLQMLTSVQRALLLSNPEMQKNLTPDQVVRLKANSTLDPKSDLADIEMYQRILQIVAENPTAYGLDPLVTENGGLRAIYRQGTPMEAVKIISPVTQLVAQFEKLVPYAGKLADELELRMRVDTQIEQEARPYQNLDPATLGKPSALILPPQNLNQGLGRFPNQNLTPAQILQRNRANTSPFQPGYPSNIRIAPGSRVGSVSADANSSVDIGTINVRSESRFLKRRDFISLTALAGAVAFVSRLVSAAESQIPQTEEKPKELKDMTSEELLASLDPQDNLESSKKMLQTMIAWLKAKNYPAVAILDLYSKRLDESVTELHATRKGSMILSKELGKDLQINIQIDPKELANRIREFKVMGSGDLFVYVFVSHLIREAFGTALFETNATEMTEGNEAINQKLFINGKFVVTGEYDTKKEILYRHAANIMAAEAAEVNQEAVAAVLLEKNGFVSTAKLNALISSDKKAKQIVLNSTLGQFVFGMKANVQEYVQQVAGNFLIDMGLKAAIRNGKAASGYGAYHAIMLIEMERYRESGEKKEGVNPEVEAALKRGETIDINELVPVFNIMFPLLNQKMNAFLKSTNEKFPARSEDREGEELTLESLSQRVKSISFWTQVSLLTSSAILVISLFIFVLFATNTWFELQNSRRLQDEIFELKGTIQQLQVDSNQRNSLERKIRALEERVNELENLQSPLQVIPFPFFQEDPELEPEPENPNLFKRRDPDAPLLVVRSEHRKGDEIVVPLAFAALLAVSAWVFNRPQSEMASRDRFSAGIFTNTLPEIVWDQLITNSVTNVSLPNAKPSQSIGVLIELPFSSRSEWRSPILGLMQAAFVVIGLSAAFVINAVGNFIPSQKAQYFLEEVLLGKLIQFMAWLEKGMRKIASHSNQTSVSHRSEAREGEDEPAGDSTASGHQPLKLSRREPSVPRPVPAPLPEARSAEEENAGLSSAETASSHVPVSSESEEARIAKEFNAWVVQHYHLIPTFYVKEWKTAVHPVPMFTALDLTQAQLPVINDPNAEVILIPFPSLLYTQETDGVAKAVAAVKTAITNALAPKYRFGKWNLRLISFLGGDVFKTQMGVLDLLIGSKDIKGARSELRVPSDKPVWLGLDSMSADWQRMNTIVWVYLEGKRRGETLAVEALKPVALARLEQMGLKVDSAHFDNLWKEISESGILKNEQVAALGSDDPFYIRAKLLEAGTDPDVLLKTLNEYEEASEEWPLYPLESRWALLRAVALMSKEEQTQLVRQLMADPGRFGKLRNVDTLFLMLGEELLSSTEWDLYIENWIFKNAPNLLGRDIYYVSPETWLLAGGLGRVGQYHVRAVQKLLAKQGRILTIEPLYHEKIHMDGRVEKLNYEALETPITGLHTVYEFNITVDHKVVPVVVKEGLTQDGIPVFLIDGGRYYTRALYKYGSSYESSTWTEFTEFFSRASLELVRLREKEKQQQQGAAYKAPVIWGNDGQSGFLPAYKRLLDKAKAVLRGALVWFTTHTFGNRGYFGWDSGFLSSVQLRNDPFPRLFTNRKDQSWDVTGGGVEAADGVNGVAAAHRHEVSRKNPGTTEVAIPNGDHLEKSSAFFRKILTRLFPDADVWRPTGEQILKTKAQGIRELNPKLKERWGVEFNPDAPVISYTGRFVYEKAGLMRAFTIHNIRNMIFSGANVAYFGNVQRTQDWDFDELAREAKNINAEAERWEIANPGKKLGRIIVATGWNLTEQVEILGITHVLVLDSNYKTGASEITEANVTVNGGLIMGPTWTEGNIQKIGVVLNPEVAGSGNIVIPAHDGSQAYLDVLLRQIKQFYEKPEHFGTYLATSVLLSRVVNANLPGSEYLLQFESNLRRKEALEKLNELFRSVQRPSADLEQELTRISQLTRDQAAKLYGEDKLFAIMSTAAFLYPKTLPNFAAWKLDEYSMLERYLNDPLNQELFGEDVVVRIHKSDNPHVFEFSRISPKSPRVLAPVVYFGNKAWDRLEGKVWTDGFENQALLIAAPEQVYRIGDYSVPGTDAVRIYDKRPLGKEIGREHRVGIPILNHFSHVANAHHLGLSAQLLFFEPDVARSELRRTMGVIGGVMLSPAFAPVVIPAVIFEPQILVVMGTTTFIGLMTFSAVQKIIQNPLIPKFTVYFLFLAAVGVGATLFVGGLAAFIVAGLWAGWSYPTKSSEFASADAALIPAAEHVVKILRRKNLAYEVNIQEHLVTITVPALKHTFSLSHILDSHTFNSVEVKWGTTGDQESHFRDMERDDLGRPKTALNLAGKMMKSWGAQNRSEERVSKAIRKFGRTGEKLYVLGLGMMEFGRRWNNQAPAYKVPTPEEVDQFMFAALKEIEGQESAKIMLDTANAYGLSEVVIEQFFKRHPELRNKFFIATKWGLRYDPSSEEETRDYSSANLTASLSQSISTLGTVDLLLLHGTRMETLLSLSPAVIPGMVRAKQEGKTRFIGASISAEALLEQALNDGLLDSFDVVQTRAENFLKRPDLIRRLEDKGIAVVLNSPVRFEGGIANAEDIYDRLIRAEEAQPIILTGTRNHLPETLQYVDAALKAAELYHSEPSHPIQSLTLRSDEDTMFDLNLDLASRTILHAKKAVDSEGNDNWMNTQNVNYYAISILIEVGQEVVSRPENALAVVSRVIQRRKELLESREVKVQDVFNKVFEFFTAVRGKDALRELAERNERHEGARSEHRMFGDRVNIFPERDSMGTAAARLGIERVKSLLKTQKRVRIMFAAAPSQVETVREFVRLSIKEKIDWNRLDIFHMDEFGGFNIGERVSFRNWIHENVHQRLQRSGVPSHHIHIEYIPANSRDRGELDAAAKKYETLLEKPLDVLFMGYGYNAHVAFNDPPADFKTKRKVIVVDPSKDPINAKQQIADYPEFFKEPGDIPLAVSVTLPYLKQSGLIIATVPGEVKAQAIRDTHANQSLPADPNVPATFFNDLPADRIQIFTNEAGAALLPLGTMQELKFLSAVLDPKKAYTRQPSYALIQQVQKQMQKLSREEEVLVYAQNALKEARKAIEAELHTYWQSKDETTNRLVANAFNRLDRIFGGTDKKLGKERSFNDAEIADILRLFTADLSSLMRGVRDRVELVQSQGFTQEVDRSEKGARSEARTKIYRVQKQYFIHRLIQDPKNSIAVSDLGGNLVDWISGGEQMLYHVRNGTLMTESGIAATGGAPNMEIWSSRVPEGKLINYLGQAVNMLDPSGGLRQYLRLIPGEGETQNALHGILDKVKWNITSGVDPDGDFIQAQVRTNQFPEIQKAFGDVEVIVTYRLKDGEISALKRIINHEKEKSIIWGSGTHFWFQLFNRAQWKVFVWAKKFWPVANAKFQVSTGPAQAIEAGSEKDLSQGVLLDRNIETGFTELETELDPVSGRQLSKTVFANSTTGEKLTLRHDSPTTMGWSPMGPGKDALEKAGVASAQPTTRGNPFERDAAGNLVAPPHVIEAGKEISTYWRVERTQATQTKSESFPLTDFWGKPVGEDGEWSEAPVLSEVEELANLINEHLRLPAEEQVIGEDDMSFIYAHSPDHGEGLAAIRAEIKRRQVMANPLKHLEALYQTQRYSFNELARFVFSAQPILTGNSAEILEENGFITRTLSGWVITPEIEKTIKDESKINFDKGVFFIPQNPKVSKRSEIRAEAATGLSPQRERVIRVHRERIVPEFVRQELGEPAFEAVVHLITEDVNAKPASIVLNAKLTEFLNQNPGLAGILNTALPSEMMNSIFDAETAAAPEPVNLAPLLIYLAKHSTVQYTLTLAGNSAQVDAFKKQLSAFSKSKLGFDPLVDLKNQFHIQAVANVEDLPKAVSRRLIGQKNQAMAVVGTENFVQSIAAARNRARVAIYDAKSKSAVLIIVADDLARLAQNRFLIEDRELLAASRYQQIATEIRALQLFLSAA